MDRQHFESENLRIVAGGDLQFLLIRPAINRSIRVSLESEGRRLLPDPDGG